MSFDWTLAIRYLQSKKRSFISVGTLFAIIGVALGVAALATVMSVTGGFQKQFRDKVLGVNAHVLILKRTPEFHEYRVRMDQVAKVPGVVAVAPFVINPMLVTAGERTATGVLMKGVDPDRMPAVLDVPKQIIEGSLAGLRRPGAKPPERSKGSFGFEDKVPTAIASSVPVPPASAPPSASAPPAPSVAPSGSAVPSDTFLDLMEKTLAEKRAENEKLAAASDAAAPEAAVDAPAPLPEEAPAGSIEPDGGYASALPPDEAENLAVETINKAEEAKVLDTDVPGVAIGATLAKTLNVKVGERIRVTSPAIGFSLSGSTRAPVARSFRVIAIFEAGFDQYDSKLVYVDLYEAQAFYDQGDSVTGVEMRVADIDESKKVKAGIEKLLNNGLYHVMDWEELNRPLFTALKIQQILMSAVLALIIIVAAFTVVATLIMIVLDKRKEIAVLKAMGARDGAILRTFLYQGLVIGLIGTTIGLALGFAVCRGLLVYGFPLDPKVYFISRLPVEIRAQDFLATGGIAILICLVATIIPAMHAATLRPAEGLRAQ
ncbi:MAG: ABC transporter permease [Deltaproteobacteria bacterium]|nr:ABC transporter permease [Deltaproteobacteria bacterium]